MTVKQLTSLQISKFIYLAASLRFFLATQAAQSVERCVALHWQPSSGSGDKKYIRRQSSVKIAFDNLFMHLIWFHFTLIVIMQLLFVIPVIQYKSYIDNCLLISVYHSVSNLKEVAKLNETFYTKTCRIWFFGGSSWQTLGLAALRVVVKNHRFEFKLSFFVVAAILFEDAIILGAESDTILYSARSISTTLLPFSTLERTVTENSRDPNIVKILNIYTM